jgi:hypothetical protein
MTNKLWVKSHYWGGAGWGAKMLSHCIFFQGCPCLNFNHGNIGAFFPIFLHNMVDYSTKNSTTIFFLTYSLQFQNIFVKKKCTLMCNKKCKYTQKMIEMIFSLYEICNIY